MVRGRKLEKVMLLCIVLASAVAATIEDDEKDCADQLTNLASCIPYVSGSSSKPTAECCENTKKVKSAKPKCLCVLIKESTDPSIGLPINTTLALAMPSACNIDAKPSECPSLLNLPPDSPDAKIFKGADAGTSTSASTATNATPTSSGSTTSPSSSSDSSSSSNSKTTTNTNAGANLAGLSFGWTFIWMVLVAIGWTLI